MTPIFVNQQEAASMLGMSIKTFVRLRNVDHRLMPAVIPDTGMERYLVSDLEEWARTLKYPAHQDNQAGAMWGDDQGAA